MKVEQRSSDELHIILTGMITDDLVCGQIAGEWPKPPQDPPFPDKWSNMIAGWCVKHHLKYQKAPRGSLPAIYQQWAESKMRDKTVVELIDRFLHYLNDEYEAAEDAPSSKYVVDLAVDYFDRVRMRRAGEGILLALETGDKEAAAKHLVNANRPMNVGKKAVLEIGNPEMVMLPYQKDRNTLITFPGARGQFFGNALQRGAFVSFTAPEKAGKTWQLMELAWWGMLQRRRVLFFELGDMSETDMAERLNSRAARRPRWRSVVQYPKQIRKHPKGGYEVVHQEKVYTESLDMHDAMEAFEQIARNKVKSKTSYFKMITYAANEASVITLRNDIDRQCQAGWVPDLVIADYADIMGPMPGSDRYESRDQINETWKALRALSQSYDCLLATATQAAATSYDANRITNKNFSNDKRKWAHITAAIGIAATDTEKRRGIYRMNWIMQRAADAGVAQQLICAPCFPLANPCVECCFPHEVS